MSDWIGLAILALLVAGAYFGLSQLSKPQRITTEDFEKKLEEGTSLVGAGFMELRKILDPK
jgi:hypothetical protein